MGPMGHQSGLRPHLFPPRENRREPEAQPSPHPGREPWGQASTSPTRFDSPASDVSKFRPKRERGAGNIILGDVGWRGEQWGLSTEGRV